MRGARLLVIEGERHRADSIGALLAITDHTIIETAHTIDSAVHLAGKIGINGANVLLLDLNLPDLPGRNDTDAGDGRAILAATALATAMARDAGDSTPKLRVIGTSPYPMSHYGITEVDLDIGQGGLPDLPRVLDQL